jgi:hypothetical protein
MTLPQRLLHTMTDPRARCGYHHLCAILRAAASSGPGDSQPEPHRAAMHHQKRCETKGHSSTLAWLHPKTPAALASIPHRAS